MLKFVSGWAGFGGLFPEISSRHGFYVPFATHTEEEINYLLNEGGELLAGWSTGAHIILKNIDSLIDKYDKIFLFAPFTSFTHYQNMKTVMLMIKKMKKDPKSVLKDFYENCGVTGFLPEIDEELQKRLIEGLEFLMESEAVISGCKMQKAKVIAVHGIDDMIVSYRAGEDIARVLCGGELLSVNGGHYINEQIISDIIYENTHKKIF